METDKKISVDEFYDYITKHLTPEEALKKLLRSSLISYEKLKFNEGEAVHPVIIIANAAMDMGWMIAVEKGEGNVKGLAVGDEEYMNKLFKK